jgi:thioredoxin reductase (NADPH)
MKPEETVVVIGGGPAGMAAAIQLRRSGFDPLLIEQSEMGGLLWNAHWVENYPGFPSGITGPQLVRLFQEQTRNTGVRTERASVERVRSQNRAFVVDTDAGRVPARAVIIASGTSPRRLDPDIVRMCGLASLYYEVKDVPGERRRRIAILGGGDAAFDFALGLSREGCRTDILFRSPRPRALPLLAERAQREPLIHIHAGVTVDSIRNGSSALEIRLSDGRLLTAEALLAAIGRERNVEFLEPGIAARVEGNGSSPLPGMIFAGDVWRGLHRQTAIAVGDGVSAAMKTSAFLSSPEE